MANKFFLLPFLLTCALYINAQTKPVKELAPGVFYYFGDETQQKSANCTWIVFKDYVLAIDANYPWGAEEILQEIKKTTDKPIKFVFNTHYHHDHTFGNANFVDAGATVVSTTTTAEEMRTLGQYEWEHGYSPRDMKGYRREYPTLLFNDTIVFDDSIHRVELIRMGPAHTAGDGIAFLPKEKILVTGDLFVIGIPWGNNVADPHADYDKWLKVLEKMESWKPQIVIPGHGEPSTTKQLKDQRSYLQDMLKQVRKGIKAGETKEQLIREVDLSKHPVYGENTVSIKRSVGDMYDNLTRKKNSKN
jgi:glyoxylase-like metal-dependent hydrolase (beta-lactamase superfamily II)